MLQILVDKEGNLDDFLNLNEQLSAKKYLPSSV